MKEMVSTYFMVKVLQNNSTNKSVFQVFQSPRADKCRICLKSANIPIYGENSELGIYKAVRYFGDIDIDEDDEFPKFICGKCYEMLQCALLFKKIAQQSQEILKKRIKEEDSSGFEDAIVKTIEKTNNVFIEKPIKQEDSNPDSLDSGDDFSDKEFLVESKPSSSSNPYEQYYKPVFNNEDGGEDDNKDKPKRLLKVQCLICSKVVTKMYYSEHFTLHDATIPKHVCHICGSSFRQRSAFINHSKIHKNVFRYKCSFCPYKAHSKDLLEKHRRTHTGEYRYMCTECPERFIVKSNLNRHVMRKHREPRFRCEMCLKPFYTKPDLEGHHQSVHIGIRNYVCTECGKAFVNRKGLMRHQLDVHKREKMAKGRTPSYLLAEQKGSV